MDKKYKIKSGERVRIEINPASAAQVANPKATTKSKGLIRSRRETDYLARRKTRGSIVFYDLGRLLTGETHYYSFLPTITPSGSDLYLDVPGISELERDELISGLFEAVFATAPINWKQTYHKIVKNEAFEKAISISFIDGADTISGKLNEIEKWTAGGLKLTQENLNTLALSNDGILFQGFSYDFAADNEDIKITTTNDINADEVDFMPTLDMEIYLMPGFVFTSADAEYYNGLHEFDDENGHHADLIRNREFLNAIYSTFPRDFYDNLLAAGEAETTYLVNYKIAKIINQFADARARHGVRDFIEAPPYNYVDTWSGLAPSGFPFSTIYTPIGINNAGHVYDISFETSLGGMDWQRLVMIIKKGSSWFYFWRLVAE